MHLLSVPETMLGDKPVTWSDEVSAFVEHMFWGREDITSSYIYFNFIWYISEEKYSGTREWSD